MEKLLIDPKPKYLPLYEPIEPPLLPAKYPEIIPSETSTPVSLPVELNPIPSPLPIPKKSFSYSVIICMVALVCFVFFAIYYNYKSDKNRKNHILPIYTKNYKVSLDELKDDAKKFIKNTVDTVSSYRDYIQNLGGKYFSNTYIEKGTLRTSAPTIPPKPTPKKKLAAATTTAASSSINPANTIKSTPANTTAPTTITKESNAAKIKQPKEDDNEDAIKKTK
jgi:hypothetical protein